MFKEEIKKESEGETNFTFDCLEYYGGEEINDIDTNTEIDNTAQTDLDYLSEPKTKIKTKQKVPKKCNQKTKKNKATPTVVNGEKKRRGRKPKPKDDQDLGPSFCGECGKQFSTKDNLNRHMKYVHGNTDEKFKCDECNYETTRRYHLKEHKARIHQVYF